MVEKRGDGGIDLLEAFGADSAVVEACRQLRRFIVADFADECHVPKPWVALLALKEEVVGVDTIGVGVRLAAVSSPFLAHHTQSALHQFLHLADQQLGHGVHLPVGLQGVGHHAAFVVGISLAGEADGLRAPFSDKTGEGMHYFNKVVVLQRYGSSASGDALALGEQMSFAVAHEVAPLVAIDVVDVAPPGVAKGLHGVPCLFCP